MKFKALTPSLKTKDMKGTIDFYQKVLGFTVDTLWPTDDLAWGFMLSLLTGAFLSHLSEWSASPDTSEWGISAGGFVVIIAALVVVSLCGLVSTVSRARQP